MMDNAASVIENYLLAVQARVNQIIDPDTKKPVQIPDFEKLMAAARGIDKAQYPAQCMAIINNLLGGTALRCASFIPIGLYGYYASQQANRVNRTFDFYKDFRGDGLQKDFSLLVTRWNEKSAQADGFLKSDDFTGLSQLAASLLQTDETQTALSRLVLFFDEAYSCVDKSLCDNNAAFALLQNPADQIFSMYGSYLATVRQQHPNYADGIVKVRALSKSWSLL